jgi:hypothetical protein
MESACKTPRRVCSASRVDIDAVPLADEIGGVVQGRQHAETQQVELDESDSGAIVLVPLQDAAVLHAPPLDGTHLDDRTVADDHAARVDAEVAREVLDLLRELEHRRRELVGVGGGYRRPTVDGLRERVLLPGGVPERLGDVAHRGLGPVGDDVGDLRGVMAAVPLIDVLDDLFASIALDVDVDVGWAVALGRRTARTTGRGHGIGVGDAEARSEPRSSPRTSWQKMLARLQGCTGHTTRK